MKIFVFQDIHSNIEALSAIENTSDYKDADIRIFLGDLIGLGPDCQECVDKIKTMDTINLMGNHDYWVADHIGIKELHKCDIEKITHEQHFRKMLSKEDKAYIRTFKKDYLLEFQGKRFYFTHFKWVSEEDTMHAPNRDSNELDELFKDINADYVIYGHEHDPSVHISKNKTYITFGSSGITHPGYYGVINIDEDGKVTIAQKTIDYNVDAVENRIKEYQYPFYWKFITFYRCEKFMIDINDKLKLIN